MDYELRYNAYKDEIEVRIDNDVAVLMKDPNVSCVLGKEKYTYQLFKDKKNIICTDSMYSINCIDKWSKSWSKNGWKNNKGQDVKNKELIQGILNSQESINQDIKIIFKHVPAHMQEPNDKKSLEWIMWYGNNKVDSNINELLDKSKDD